MAGEPPDPAPADADIQQLPVLIEQPVERRLAHLSPWSTIVAEVVFVGRLDHAHGVRPGRLRPWPRVPGDVPDRPLGLDRCPLQPQDLTGRDVLDRAAPHVRPPLLTAVGQGPPLATAGLADVEQDVVAVAVAA